MQAVEKIFRERTRFAKSKLSGGEPPSPSQLSSFLKSLVDSLRPHIGASPPDAREMLRQTFLTVSWDVCTKAALPGSTPCSTGELIKFLETAGQRLRIGVVTAGWGEYQSTAQVGQTTESNKERKPKPDNTVTKAHGKPITPAGAAGKPQTPKPRDLHAEAAAIMAEPDIVAVIEQLEQNPPNVMPRIQKDHELQSKLACLVEAGLLEPPREGPFTQCGSHGPLADALAAAAQRESRNDENLLMMDPADALKEIEAEIEAQIERNHYIAQGI